MNWLNFAWACGRRNHDNVEVGRKLNRMQTNPSASPRNDDDIAPFYIGQPEGMKTCADTTRQNRRGRIID
ncbi:MAG: hypothetical protein QNK90_10875 [Opitutaceae bacterium]